MTEFGRKGIELLKEIVNHDQDSLSAYNEDLVRNIVNEVHEHDAIVQRMTNEHSHGSSQGGSSQGVSDQGWTDSLNAATAMIVHFQSAIRNKKLLLAYMMQRMERLKTMRWAQRSIPLNMATNCSPQELEFHKSYDKLLSSYMSKDGGVGLDLTLDSKPPKTNNILVKVLESQGDMMFSFGQANLVRGTLHLLPVEEAEPLIREGSVEPVDTKV